MSKYVSTKTNDELLELFISCLESEHPVKSTIDNMGFVDFASFFGGIYRDSVTNETVQFAMSYKDIMGIVWETADVDVMRDNNMPADYVPEIASTKRRFNKAVREGKLSYNGSFMSINATSPKDLKFVKRLYPHYCPDCKEEFQDDEFVTFFPTVQECWIIVHTKCNDKDSDRYVKFMIADKEKTV